ncbi:MAG TPA: PEP-CTERM sorting domain-containing protein [Gammaproteobacteria bacterium]|nr:PEP-CTERM sorting domain-containing protein [Gammaproteobacteria bacterium]
MRLNIQTAVLGIAAVVGTAAALPAHAIAITYDDLDPQTIFTQPFGFPGTSNLAFDVTNDTSETWTDFHVLLQQDGGAPSTVAFFDDLGAVGYIGPGTGTFSGLGAIDSFLDVIGLAVAPSDVFSFTVGLLTGEGAPSYSLIAEPSTATHSGILSIGGGGTDGGGGTGGGGGTTQVPEPGVLALLAAGLAALLIAQRGKITPAACAAR